MYIRGNAFWFNFIPVTIGSIVGAWFLVIPFWFVNKDGFWKRQEREAAERERLVSKATSESFIRTE